MSFVVKEQKGVPLSPSRTFLQIKANREGDREHDQAASIAACYAGCVLYRSCGEKHTRPFAKSEEDKRQRAKLMSNVSLLSVFVKLYLWSFLVFSVLFGWRGEGLLLDEFCDNAFPSRAHARL